MFSRSLLPAAIAWFALSTGLFFSRLSAAQDFQPLDPPAQSSPSDTTQTSNELNRSTAPSKQATMPQDAQTATASAPLISALQHGGPMLLALAVCSFILFIFVFERAICLRTGRVIPRPFVRRFIQQLRANELAQQEAIRLCQENKSPVADVFAAAIKKWGRPSVEVEQAVLDTGERVANRLRKYLRLFHGISTISPLLGLLGTVLGMISSFNAIATSDAMGRPELLASGISQALLTTAAGLTVAIPAIAAHLYFVGRVDRLVMEIDALSQDVVNAIASDGWRESVDGKTEKNKKTTKPTRTKAA